MRTAIRSSIRQHAAGSQYVYAPALAQSSEDYCRRRVEDAIEPVRVKANKAAMAKVRMKIIMAVSTDSSSHATGQTMAFIFSKMDARIDDLVCGKTDNCPRCRTIFPATVSMY